MSTDRRAVPRPFRVRGRISHPRVVSERVENVQEKPWNVIEYIVGEAGQELQFQNFYYSQPGFGSVQVVFWSVPSDATVAAYHAGRVLSSVSYGN